MTGSDLGSAFAGLFFIFVIGLCLLPFGLWKLVEVIIWLWQHIHLSFG